MMTTNAVLRAVVRELDGRDYKIENGKHIKVKFQSPNGKQRMVVLSRTSGDEFRALKNAVGDVRRILRRDGI